MLIAFNRDHSIFHQASMLAECRAAINRITILSSSLFNDPANGKPEFLPFDGSRVRRPVP